MKIDPARIALVTGAARGIGRATTNLLLEKGYRVVAVDRVAIDSSSSAGSPVNQNLWSASVDVTDHAAIAALRDEISKRWGDVAIVVNNAAISPKKANGRSAGILEIDDQEWQQVLAVNLTAVLKIAQAFLPGMQAGKWGRIVNVSSLAGRTKSIAAGASYMSSKAGVLALTRAIAGEMGPYGITANAIAPGRILTDMAMLSGPEANQLHAQQVPVRRLGTAEEVAASIAFLASEEAGFINGAVLDINGGFYMP